MNSKNLCSFCTVEKDSVSTNPSPISSRIIFFIKVATRSLNLYIQDSLFFQPFHSEVFQNSNLKQIFRTPIVWDMIIVEILYWHGWQQDAVIDDSVNEWGPEFWGLMVDDKMICDTSLMVSWTTIEFLNRDSFVVTYQTIIFFAWIASQYST